MPPGKSKMEVNLDFVAVGVNRVVNALDWSEDGTVAFGAHHMAAIYDTKVGAWRWGPLCSAVGVCTKRPPAQHTC